MASYQFRKDGVPVTLEEVDVYICGRLGIEVSAERYSSAYMKAVLVGMASSFDAGVADPNRAKEAIADMMGSTGSQTSLSELVAEIVFDVVCGTYQFHSWR